MTQSPLLALTLGDPAGIGPELALHACDRFAATQGEAAGLTPRATLAILGDRAPLEAAASATGLSIPARAVALSALKGMQAEAIRAKLLEQPGPVLIETGALSHAVPWGKPTPGAGAASYQYINLAIDWSMDGVIDGFTTLPITKATLHMAGVHEPGHTEILARRTGTTDYAMMLYSDRIAVTLVTIHQSLASVPGALKISEICRITRLADSMLARVRGRRPKLAVLGLNPHAGEGGMFGKEEETVIAPAIAHLKSEGLDVEGPLPPDAGFTPRARERYDGHIVMYHDQGLIPFKMISVHDGVNVTLGLPIVRTSPDHGTAYDIAGQNKADVTSTLAALRLAARMAVGA